MVYNSQRTEIYREKKGGDIYGQAKESAACL